MAFLMLKKIEKNSIGTSIFRCLFILAKYPATVGQHFCIAMII